MITMFGAAQRAAARIAAGRTVVAFGIVHSYDPQRVAAAAAAGFGAGAVGSGATLARTPRGTESALGIAIGRVAAWGESESARFARLPHTVLLVVLDDAAVLSEWTVAGAAPRSVRWQHGSFTAERHRSIGEVSVRVVLTDGKIAILSARTGPHHRRAHLALAALARQGAASQVP
jgi:hypothetical protein